MRKDSWSQDDDLLLAEVVLRHIREGGTRLIAFEEVANKLQRTSDACAFRWNTVLKEKYETAIDIAKKASRLSNVETPQIEEPIKQQIKPKVKKEKKKEEVVQKEKKKTTATSPKQKKKSPEKKQPVSKPTQKKKLSEDSLEQSLRVLQDHLKVYLTIKKDLDQANEKVSVLEQENQQLKEKVGELEKDYAQVIAIINKAQQMIS